MIYALIGDLKAALPSTMFDAITYGGDAEDVSARLQSSIDAATAEIDGYLAKPYNLPFTAESNQRLRDLTIDITAYKLARDYGSLTENIEKRYKEAIDYLKLVGKGGAFLPEPLYEIGETTEDARVGTRGKPDIQSSPRLFTRDSLKEY